MQKILLRSVSLLSVVIFLVATCRAQTSPRGNWVGGTNVAGRWMFIQVRFEGGTPPAGSIDIPSLNVMRLPLANIDASSGKINFDINSPLGIYSFAGTFAGGVIAGEVTSKNARGKMHLVRAAAIDQKLLQDYVGSYQPQANQTILVTQNPFNQLTVFVTEASGSSEAITRSLNLIPSSDNSFFSSKSAIAPPTDPDEIVTFTRGTKGEINALVWQQPNGSKITAPKLVAPFRQEAITFHNGAVTLGGTLLSPLSNEPHAAMVVVQGSGPTTRDNALMFLRAQRFVQMGIAVLLYDKRGTGDPSGGYWQSATFSDLAGDALAAVAFLKQRKDIRSQEIGFQGNSEAGWVIPIAANASTDISFVIICSGGGISVIDSELREADSYASSNKLTPQDRDELFRFIRLKWDYVTTRSGWGEYEAAAKNAQAKPWFATINGPLTNDPQVWRQFGLRKDKDSESEQLIEHLKPPVLVLFGSPELDTEVPVTQAMAAWERAMQKSSNKDYSISSVDAVGHSLFFRAEGGKTVFAPEPFGLVKAWLSKHVELGN